MSVQSHSVVEGALELELVIVVCFFKVGENMRIGHSHYTQPPTDHIPNHNISVSLALPSALLKFMWVRHLILTDGQLSSRM